MDFSFHTEKHAHAHRLIERLANGGTLFERLAAGWLTRIGTRAALRRRRRCGSACLLLLRCGAAGRERSTLWRRTARRSRRSFPVQSIWPHPLRCGAARTRNAAQRVHARAAAAAAAMSRGGDGETSLPGAAPGMPAVSTAQHLAGVQMWTQLAQQVPWPTFGVHCNR